MPFFLQSNCTRGRENSADKFKNASSAIFLAFCTLILAAFQPMPARHEKTSELPSLILWAWTHNDDLRFVNSRDTAIAFYAGTIVLGLETANLQSRKNSLRINERVTCFPVFRIEKAHRNEAASAKALDRANEIIHAYLAEHPSKIVQIDFDADTTDRQSYLIFLQELRKRLPRGTAVSITALASWCLDDKWLQHAPVDESVAMMFSMGKGHKDAIELLSKRKLDSGSDCRQSIGISVSEENTNKKLKEFNCFENKHIYAFSSLGWTKQRYDHLREEVGY
ncbi:MAG: DUF3142 domain-containing protein [Candidatus Obscuribacterales bacterium]|nr:DUF3142 domain-containing protein [Candidatus Obscuribacterales bacterium]